MELLKRLSEAHGIAGNEGAVRAIMEAELKASCQVEVDALGNLIARKGNGERKIMLAAHMDEIGLMVKYIDKNGFIKFATIGGFFDQTLLNQRVLIHTPRGQVCGVIGSKPPHLMKDEERKKVVEYRDMFIDVGARSAEAAKALGVGLGDCITFDRSFRELSGGLVTGKAFDDRIACYILVQVMREVEAEATVYAVGTTQEEVGFKGARTASYRINPDMAIALDVTTAGDYPGIREEESSLKVGQGPAITLVDASGRGLITHPKVKEMLIATAERHKIPYQLEVGEGGTTDATGIHITREGIPSGVVSIPTRYIHTPVEVASMEDIRNAVKLVRLALEECRW